MKLQQITSKLIDVTDQSHFDMAIINIDENTYSVPSNVGWRNVNQNIRFIAQLFGYMRAENIIIKVEDVRANGDPTELPEIFQHETGIPLNILYSMYDDVVLTKQHFLKKDVGKKLKLKPEDTLAILVPDEGDGDGIKYQFGSNFIQADDGSWICDEWHPIELLHRFVKSNNVKSGESCMYQHHVWQASPFIRHWICYGDGDSHMQSVQRHSLSKTAFKRQDFSIPHTTEQIEKIFQACMYKYSPNKGEILGINITRDKWLEMCDNSTLSLSWTLINPDGEIEHS